MNLGESIRRRRTSKGKAERSRKRPRRVETPAWKLGARRRRALKWPGWKPKSGWKPKAGWRRPDWEWRWKPRLSGLKRRPGPLVVALILAGAGLGGGYAASTIWFFPPPEAPPDPRGVPDLRGGPLAGALAMLADSSLAAGAVDSIRHPTALAGTVIGQDPLPGRTALPGAEVRVTISVGPEVRLVPDVTRLPGSRAVATLEAGGFVVRVDTVRADLPAGRIIALEPPPGTETTMPGSVLLRVSRGPPTFPMPSLLGYGESQARSFLAALGLSVSVIDRRYSILNVDRVFGQYPEPNAAVASGARVRLIVGRSLGWVLYEPQGAGPGTGAARSRTPSRPPTPPPPQPLPRPEGG